MEWADIISGAVSVGSGGVFGLIGSGIGAISKYFQEKQRQNWKLKEWDHEKDLLKMQMEAQKVETELEMAISAQEGSYNGLSASIEAETALKSNHPAVNGIRSLFRPFVTVMIWVLATWVFYEVVKGSLKVWFDQVEIKDIIQYMVYTIFFCASTALMWWFGDRALMPPWLKNK